MLVVLLVAIGALIFKAIKGPPRPSTLKEVTLAQMDLKQQEQELEAAFKAIRDQEKQKDVEAGAKEEEED